MDDIYSVLKAISICLSGHFIYRNLIELSNVPVKIRYLDHIVIMIICFCVANEIITIEPAKTIMILVSISFVTSKRYKYRFDDTFIYMLISLSVTYIIYAICAFLSPIVLIAVFHISKDSLLQPVVSDLLLIFTSAFISKHLYMPVPHENKNSIISIFLSVIIYIFYSLLANETLLYDSAIVIAMTGECLCLLILLLWLRNLKAAAFNRSVYRTSLKKETVKYEELQSSHDDLEHKVHRDRKLLLSLYQAVEMLANDSTEEKTKLKALKLISELKEIRTDESYQSKDDIGIPMTDISMINALFRFMSEIARSNDIHIRYNVDRVISKILEHISISQLERLIADLMENAIIAVKAVNKNKTISVDFGMKRDDYFQFIISDNGVPFSKATLDVLGKRRTTTHSNTGGSGIGYMSIFEILQSTKASLTIDQRGQEKIIIVRFDGKADFVIK